MEIYEDMNNFNKMSIDQINDRYKDIINLGYTVECIWEMIIYLNQSKKISLNK